MVKKRTTKKNNKISDNKGENKKKEGEKSFV
jgi:hypothetical protein